MGNGLGQTGETREYDVALAVGPGRRRHAGDSGARIVQRCFLVTSFLDGPARIAIDVKSFPDVLNMTLLQQCNIHSNISMFVFLTVYLSACLLVCL